LLRPFVNQNEARTQPGVS